MTIPVLCPNCHKMAHHKRCAFAWVTFCHACMYSEVRYDTIYMGQDK